MGNDRLFNKWRWESWTAPCRRMKPDHCLTPHRKINLKWMRDPRVRPETTKLLEDKAGSNDSATGHRNIFLDVSPETRERKAKLSYPHLATIWKGFAQRRNHQQKEKGEAPDWRKILASGTYGNLNI